MSSFKIPKDNPKYHWTNHVVRKMQFYGITPSRVLRVIRAPDRIEEGIVDGTLAAMQKSGSKSRPWELWTMWRQESRKGSSQKGLSKKGLSNLSCSNLEPNRKVIITAWRYPGISPIRDKVPIPAEIISELETEGILD